MSEVVFGAVGVGVLTPVLDRLHELGPRHGPSEVDQQGFVPGERLAGTAPRQRPQQRHVAQLDVPDRERPGGGGHVPQPAPQPHLGPGLTHRQPAAVRHPVATAAGPVIGPHPPGIQSCGQAVAGGGQPGGLAVQVDDGGVVESVGIQAQ